MNTEGGRDECLVKCTGKVGEMKCERRHQFFVFFSVWGIHNEADNKDPIEFQQLYSEHLIKIILMSL